MGMKKTKDCHNIKARTWNSFRESVDSVSASKRNPRLPPFFCKYFSECDGCISMMSRERERERRLRRRLWGHVKAVQFQFPQVNRSSCPVRDGNWWMSRITGKKFGRTLLQTRIKSEMLSGRASVSPLRFWKYVIRFPVSKYLICFA